MHDLVSKPPAPLRAEWGTTPAAVTAARAAYAETGGPAPLRDNGTPPAARGRLPDVPEGTATQ